MDDANEPVEKISAIGSQERRRSLTRGSFTPRFPARQSLRNLP